MTPTPRLFGLAAILLCTVALGPAGAAEITVLSAGAIRSVLEALVPRFQKETGHHVVVAYGTAGEVERRLKEQEAVDVAIATKPRIQTLEGAGTIVAGSVGMIGRSPIALAVRQGPPKPDSGSVDAFKRALLAAKSVAYTDPASGGTSGIHIATVLRRLGIADQLQPRTKLVTGRPGAPPAVGEAVAHGEAELGMQPISELIGTPGIEIVGLIPAELQTPDLTYAAGLATRAEDRQAGMALIGFVSGAAGAAERVAIVTGASAGIGLHTALGLAGGGMHVLMVGRDPGRTERARRLVAERSASRQGTSALADFASLAAVRYLAETILATHPRIDVLVNNAGLISPHLQLSEDGYEMTIAVNHLAPFLLTNLLLDRLRASAPARIVTVASQAHRGARLDLAELGQPREWSPLSAYGRSKLCNILFTSALARRLDPRQVTAACPHPVVVATEIGG